MESFAITQEDVKKIFVALSVSPNKKVYRIVTRQELISLERFVLSWYELSEFDINFIPENIKPL